ATPWAQGPFSFPKRNLPPLGPSFLWKRVRKTIPGGLSLYPGKSACRRCKKNWRKTIFSLFLCLGNCINVTPRPMAGLKAPRQKLSALIITYNEMGYIERCIDSVSFADEILVV